MTERPNNSALSLAWLMAHLRGDGHGSRATVSERWRSVADEMRSLGPALAADSPLDSDVWLCKSASMVDGDLVPVWSPPDGFDDFAPPPARDQLAGWRYRETRHSLVDELASARSQSDGEALSTRNEALAVYLRLHALTQPPVTDPSLRPMIVTMNQCLAWLDAAVGSFFTGIILARINRQEDVQQVTSASYERIDRVAGSHRAPFAEAALVAMYGATQPVAGSFQVLPAPGGQSETWRERWGWLSQDSNPEQARRALAMSGALLANPAFVLPLLHAAKEADPLIAAVGLCTLRRIALSLRVMAWAEDALQVEWTSVRPKDVLCFAYAALRPEWPRRRVALSHRSSTVKPLLVGTRFWNSPSAALDATYVPKWETNIAMIWGLFAPAPVVVRMASSAYRASEWCERESELLDHLLERGDFLRGRVVVDAKESETARLDDFVETPTRGGTRAFPPAVELLCLPLLSENAAGVLRAAAAVRFIACIARGRAEVVAAAVRALCRGRAPSLPCPTRNLGGWDDYVAIFEALPPASPGVDDLPIRLPADYDSSTFDVERVWWAKNSPDFADPRVPPLGDHLCACEWQRVLGHSLGPDCDTHGFVIDCRALSREDWEREPARTLHRGFTSAATASAVWFLQSAGVRVDRWAAIGDYRPIFTQHVDEQLSWMILRCAPPDWMQTYLRRSGLVFSDAVAGRLAAT